MTLLDRIDADRPKRLLAVDGGGIRGVIALEILGKLQSDLRRKLRDPKLVLADVFDYISGTSTGAIIAAGLATGMSTDQLMALYVDRGAEIFSKSGWTDRLRHSYDKEALELILKDEVGADTTLGSDSLQTLLMVVLRNATTDSPWPVSNNPRARFNDRSLPDCNLDLPLWQLVRASAAAPTYFEPEVITLGDRKFVFADGCVTPFNNPAFQLFTMATLDSYRLGWPTGEDNLLLVSVGTANSEFARPDLETSDMHLLYHASATAGALMQSAAVHQDFLCRTLGRCLWGPPLDGEVGDLLSSKGLVEDRLFRYVRYDQPLNNETLEDLGLGSIRLGDVMAIDNVGAMDDMRAVGREIATRAVDLDHFAGFLNFGRAEN
ncbi:MAG: patatin-like phospholipase family protein [Candidatus Microthrix parvicella]|jgi:hypothetical protein